MVGAIRKRDVLAHPLVTIQSFGWYVFLRAIVAGRKETFLSLLADAGAMKSPKVHVSGFVERCIDLELQAGLVYQKLARRFAHHEMAAPFFESLACQERGHAELLRVCRAAVEPGRWSESSFAPLHDILQRLEQQMKDAVEFSDAVDDLTDALQLVIQIESSEINNAFRRVVATSESEFVKKVQVFWTVGTQHIDYIIRGITHLAPQLTAQCEPMRLQAFSETSFSDPAT